MSSKPNLPATADPVATPRRRLGAGTPWRKVLVATALAATAALSTAAPVGAQTQQGQVVVWIDDSFGGGTVTSQPAGINCHVVAFLNPYESEEGRPGQTGTCSASFPVGTTVTFIATPDPGSHFNSADPPRLTVGAPGYNTAWISFCPDPEASPYCWYY
ncbi:MULTISPECIES: hypothetical protein [unclassified Streptomyces]|uniref:hypothetical protein n=1 Tax=unclassified Streptomyces TaxID=2593676 RepID=UPI0023655450|nr:MULTISPECIES: hypothetical protein [unclassified Streptomyces]MDF3145322.1 hypothetical protein [Streptomyces sp. T21Q-yed]WDF38940.1 hypothetical protein PBV52_20115 [Streptomyces sp. T12]